MTDDDCGMNMSWDWTFKLTMVPEMEPISRSLVIKVISEMIEKEKLFYFGEDSKIYPTLETLSSKLWHLIRYSCKIHIPV